MDWWLKTWGYPCWILKVHWQSIGNPGEKGFWMGSTFLWPWNLFVAFQHVSRRVKKSRFAWQAQYFCYMFRRCVAFFVAGAPLWTPPMSFSVASAALWTCRVACFLWIALPALREVVTRCSGMRGILWHVMKIDGRLARNVDFAVGP